MFVRWCRRRWLSSVYTPFSFLTVAQSDGPIHDDFGRNIEVFADISAVDLDLKPRIMGPQIDIGAYENDILLIENFETGSLLGLACGQL